MANIREYNAGAGEIRPDQTGSEAYEIEGRHVGAAFNETGRQIGGAINEFEQREDQQDIAQLSNLAAQNFIKNTGSWNQTMSQTDPAKVDPAETQQKWLAGTFEPSLQDLSEAAHTDAGRKWVEQFSNEQRMHFAEKTTADVSTMSGLAVQSNLSQMIDNYSQAARMDPTAMQAILKNSDASVEANISAHSLTPDKAAQFREWYNTTGRKQIAVSSAMGAAEQNPEAFLNDLNAGKYGDFFTGEEAQHLQKFAEGIQKNAQEQGRANEQETIRQNKEAADSAGSQLAASVIQQDGSIRIPADFDKGIHQLSLMPNVSPGLVRSLVDMRRTITRESEKGAPAVTDPHTYDDFTARMALPPTDPRALTPQQIFEARAHGQLSDKDMSFFKGAVDTLAKDPNKKFAEQRFNDFMASMKPQFLPKSGAFSLTGSDPRANQRWYSFQHDARAAFEDAYTKGTWQAALDPHNSAFLGRQGAQQILNKKNADLTTDYHGQVVNGYTFMGHSAADWKNPAMWKKGQ